METFYTLIYNNIHSYLRTSGQRIEAFETNPEALAEMRRILDYRQYWKAFNNLLQMPRQEEGASSTIKVNLAKAFVDRSVDFLTGKPFSVLPFHDDISKIMAPIIQTVNKSVGIEVLQHEIITNGSITGDSFIKILWDDEIDGVRFQLLDSERCFVEYESTSKSNQRLKTALVVWEGEYEVDGSMQKVLFKERWTKETKILSCEFVKKRQGKDIRDMRLTNIFNQNFYTKDFGINAKDVQTIEIENIPNTLGFIPVVHFRNQIVPLEPYGRSDLRDVTPLNIALNEASNQYLDSVHYHGTPITIIKGAKVGNLKRGANRIWSGLPKDSSVQNLDGQQDFTAIKNLMELLMDFSYLVSGVPEASSGLFQNISNTTGVALQVQYLPLTGLTKRKQLAYTPGFVQAYEYALKMLNQKKKLNLQQAVDDYIGILKQKEMKDKVTILEDVGEYEVMLNAIEQFISSSLTKPLYHEVQIQWEDYLPKDALINLDMLEREIEAGLESKRGALRRRGIEDVDAKLAEIKKERETILNPYAEYGGYDSEEFGSDNDEYGKTYEGEDSMEAEGKAQKSEEQKSSPEAMAQKQK